MLVSFQETFSHYGGGWLAQWDVKLIQQCCDAEHFSVSDFNV